MTFYNLPETDVKVEYDKDRKILHITGIPRDLETPNVIQGYNEQTQTEEVWIIWGKVDAHNERGFQ